MDFWIRSQSKKSLVKIKKITIEDSGKFSRIMDYDSQIILGRYSKERALEVLDEFEKYINMHKMMKFDVFEMPEE